MATNEVHPSLLEQYRITHINDINKRKLLKKYCRVYKALTNLKECSKPDHDAATGDANELRKAKHKKLKKLVEKISKHARTQEKKNEPHPEETKKDTVRQLKSRPAKSGKCSVDKDSTAKSSVDNKLVPKSGKCKVEKDAAEPKQEPSESPAKKKIKCRRHVESKETQVNALGGNTARVISAVRSKRDKEVRTSTTTGQDDGAQVASKMRRIPITLPVKASATTKKSAKRASKTPVRKPHTPVDAVDTIEELPVELKLTESEVQSDAETSLSCKITKACVEYSRVGQQALSVLNDEVSAALRDSFCSIDDIQMRIRHTIDEINECDKIYQQLKTQSQCKTSAPSTAQLAELTELDQSISKVTISTQNVMQVCSEGLVTKQSANPITVADDVPKTPPEAQLTSVHDLEQFPPLPLATDEPVVSNEEPILPKLIPIVATNNQPSTLTQQKKCFNIPPCLNSIESTDKVSAQQKCKPQPKSFNVQAKKTLRDLKHLTSPVQNIAPQWPDIAQPAKDGLAAALFQEDLPRSKAQPNLHTQLVKEFEATDSLLEFQRKMKSKNKKKKKGKMAGLVAEELFIPEKKINRIATANLQSTSKHRSSDTHTKAKTTQFLYREKHKAKDQHNAAMRSKPSRKSSKASLHSMQDKYPNSVLFSPHNKKSLKQNNILAKASSSVAVKNSSMVGKYINERDNDIVEAVVQTDNSLKSDDISMLTDTPSVQFKTGLDCFDILDEITLNDLKPFEAEYPRKDHVGSRPFYKPVEESYLYKLMYGSYKNQFTKLLRYEEPMLYCQSPSCHKCTAAKNDRIIHLEDFNRTDAKCFSEKDMRGKRDKHFSKGRLKRDGRRALSNCSSKESLSLRNKSDYHQSWVGTPTNKTRPLPSARHSNSQQHRQRHSKSSKPKKVADEDVARKLRPYIFDPHMRYPTTITVMPVIVTTYANPNFIHGKKNQSGDFASGTTNKPALKGEPKEKPLKPVKPQNKPAAKKLWNSKNPKTASYNLISYLQKQNQDNPRPQQRYGDALDEIPCQDIKIAPTPGSPKSPRRRPLYPPCEPPPQDSLLIGLGQQPALKPARVVITSPMHSPRVASPKAKKPVSPRSLLHKHAAESRKLLKDIQKLSQKTKLENSIQNVIDMIESKIVEILSSPEKSHSEAFKTVEGKIVEILETLKTHDPKLEAIAEASDAKDSSTDSKAAKTKKLCSKSANSLPKQPNSAPSVELANQAKTTGCLVDETAANDVDRKSSNEERFVVTASCGPNQDDSAHSKSVGEESLDKDPIKIVVPLKDSETTKKRFINKAEASNPNKKTVDKLEDTERPNLIKQEVPISAVPIKEENPDSPPRPDEQEPSKVPNKAVVEAAVAMEEPVIVKSVVTIESIASTSDTVMYTASSATGSTSSVDTAMTAITQQAPAIVEVRSDEFLTPFMQALKHYRQEDHGNSASSILEFLDTLANINDSSTSLTRCEQKTIYYNYTIKLAQILHQSVIFYPITIHYPVTITSRCNKDLKVLFQSESIHGHRFRKLKTSDPKGAKQPLPNLNKFLICGDSLQPVTINNEVICCRVDKIVPQRRRIRASLDKLRPTPLPRSINVHSETNSKTEAVSEDVEAVFYDADAVINVAEESISDHSAILNSIYSILFSTVFFGLTFNYSCQ